MRILELHCDYFAYKAREKALKAAPEISKAEKEGKRVENVLVVFVSVEEGDDLQVARKAAEDVKKNFLEVNAATIQLHPYAHLSSNLAKPQEAIRVFDEMLSEIRKYCPQAGKSPFGYYKEFELKCKGHPLSELSKTIVSEGKTSLEGPGIGETETYKKLIEFLDKNHAHYRLIDHPPEGRAAIVSPMRGNALSQAANCIVLMLKLEKKETKYVLAVFPADTRVDFNAIKAIFGASYVAFASIDIAEKLSGSVMGTVLPFSFNPELELVVDPRLVENDEIFFNAARLDRSMALKAKDYASIAKPRLEQIARMRTSEEMSKDTEGAKEVKSIRKQVAKPELLEFAKAGVAGEGKQGEKRVVCNTASFLCAMALKRIYPQAVMASSSCGEEFFVDLEGQSISESELKRIDAEIKKLIEGKIAIKLSKIPASEALKKFSHNPYKKFLLESVPSDSVVCVAEAHGFSDLVNGEALANSSKLVAFKLLNAGGAYWLDDASNKQLQRISGVAFSSDSERQDYEKMIAEAERRDHRKLGRELKLFKFSEEVGMGLPLWMPNGEFVRHSLMEYMRKLEEENGYKYVQTPSITKSKIFYTSGHLPHYKDSMYAPIQIEGADYYLKPMNCPFHHEICKELVFSYRDLPLRIAEPGSCYRFELSGTMYGIIRTRNFTQNDSHIYCTPDQVKSEFVSVLKLFKKVYSEMGIKDYWYRLSLPDFEKNPEKYASGEDRKKWEWAAQVIRDAMKSEGEKFVEAVGEAAFYGPKIDVQVRNAFGKDDSISTIQIDVLMAKRFNLEFTNNEGKRENMVIIHRAIMGSFERFIAFLLEQCIGNLPLWLSPVQIAVLPLTDAQEDYARKVCRQLEENGYRVFFDASQEKIEKKIREAQLQKIPYMLVLGKQEEEESKISVRSRDGKVKNGIMLKDFEKDIEGEVKLKKA